jgi:hypothetical protein
LLGKEFLAFVPVFVKFDALSQIRKIDFFDYKSNERLEEKFVSNCKFLQKLQDILKAFQRNV